MTNILSEISPEKKKVYSHAQEPDSYYQRLPNFTAFFWALFCLSMIFALPVPVIDLASTTVFAVPHILYAFLFIPRNVNMKLFGLLALLTYSIVIAAMWAGNWNSTYLNFMFWLLNAYAAYKLLRHPHGREIALHIWAFGVLMIIGLRLGEIAGLADFNLFNRNGYGFMITNFFPALYWVTRKYMTPQIAGATLVLVIVTLLVNASRSSLINSTLISLILIFHYNLDFNKRVKSIISILIVGFFIVSILPNLVQFSDKLSSTVVWINAIVESGDIETLRSGEGQTIELREQLMAKSLELFRRNPYTGVGFGQYNRIRDIAAQNYLDRRNLSRLVEHNSYMLWLAETGLSGVVPLSFLIFYILINIYHSRQAYLEEKSDYLLIGLCMSLATCLTLGFVANITASGTWVMLIIVVAFYDAHEQDRQKASSSETENLLSY